MSFSLICPACGARLKLPAGCTKKKARCPRCNARVNLTAALDATAYHVDSATSLTEFTVPELPVPSIAPAKPSKPPKPTSTTPVAKSAPAAKSSSVERPSFVREEDPLPYPAQGKSEPPPKPQQELLSLDDEPPLSLDDDPAPPTVAKAPATPPPFRTPAQMNYDSAGLFTGPCEVVLVPHGMFVENIPYQPFLYVPLPSRAEVSGCEMGLTIQSTRAVTIEFVGPNAARIATDSAAFLAGERSMLNAKDYLRSSNRFLGLALIAALGLTVMSLVVFLIVKAYSVGRNHAAEETQNETPAPILPTPMPPTPTPSPEQPPPVAPRPGLPTAVDAAYRDGLFQFEEGADDVTALAMTPDGSIMLAGYKNGTSKVWRFDQLTVDPFTPGPKADGPITHIQFDNSAAIAYMTCNGGAVAAYWNEPPDTPVKILGDPFSVFTFPNGDRFAAIRGNSLALRYVPMGLVKKPVSKGKGFMTLTPRDETIPADVKGVISAPQKPTFLAWHPTGKLLGGLPDGSVVSWGATGPRFEVVSRNHKAAVRAWASSQSAWDFATGDDKGTVGLWANKALTPKTFTATTRTGTPAAITHLAFSPSGSHLAVADSEHGVWVWDLFAMRTVLRVTRLNPVRALSFGPTDDLLLLGNGKIVELWHTTELAKQP